VPVYRPGGARHAGDVSLICGSCAERVKARPDTAAYCGEREVPKRAKPQGKRWRRSQGGSGGVWVGELKSAGKSFEISTWEVQYAWEKVRANQGAAGVDGCSLGEFEADLKNQLYKIWTLQEMGVTR
jgi:hypothetical protein